ncbi:TPA: hypothetical protein JAN72_09265 [Legionella pneumophila]|jgi:hypothetical protein|uniref:Uncharacterized protein n=1 Tax=Legionella pneumophila TaxID=446 RepID=A0AAN5KR64_LEGPN|nr:hypothetical protein [Legionella pneumophila]HAT1972709.1 hypothetical protein [Legionella pneumophila]HAT6956943.1 hypothetical protein [Legionella pneumophila]HEN4770536.1 hypothetical protein [Legionella pneumophila]
MPRWFRRIVDEGERLFVEVTDELRDESEVHKAVSQLHLRVGQILNANRSRLEKPVIEAAEGFLHDLGVILEEDSRLRFPHAPINQYLLADKCTDIIYSYKPSLESAPGIWNQIKAHINNFIEIIFGLENVLPTTQTMFAKDVNFTMCKRNLSRLKESLESDAPGLLSVLVSC